jgi:hypothetical protein
MCKPTQQHNNKKHEELFQLGEEQPKALQVNLKGTVKK